MFIYTCIYVLRVLRKGHTHEKKTDGGSSPYYGYDDSWEEIKVKWIKEPITLDEVKELANGCPMCILTILRCTGLNRYYFGINYNYKEHLKDTWAEINTSLRYEEERYSGY